MKIKIERNVLLTGLTSFFTDISSEMIYPLIQAFVTMILAANKAMLGPVLGIIEGVAESTASLLKVITGYYSDIFEKRKSPVIGGYTLSALSKILLFAAAFGWYFVLISRFIDRVGKGIRTAPRDALISESVSSANQGRAFGFQRGMDYAGAFIGAAVCYFVVLHYIDPISGNLKDLESFYFLFMLSVVPAFIGVAFLFFIKEKSSRHKESKDKPKPNLNIKQYDRNLKVFFAAQILFTLGNSSNQFLLLRSMDLGYQLSSVILMYIVFNFMGSLLSMPAGIISDSRGRKKIILAGYALYAAVYTAFGFITPGYNMLLWIFWPLYGVYYALTDGVEKAFVSDIAPSGSKATALGFYHTITGITLLPASVIAGLLYSVSPELPFIAGGIFSAMAVVVITFGVKSK